MWSEHEFTLGMGSFHPMNRTSLGRAAYILGQQCGQSFSSSLGNSFRQTIAGIFAKKEMDTDKMLEGHIQATQGRCRADAGESIVVAQDTTFYNYSGHHQMEGLGKLQGEVKGVLQHNVLTMNEHGTPLGLLHQYNWTRQGPNALEVESQKWFQGLAAVNRSAAQIGKRMILVQDREADIFDFFKAPRHEQVELVVRICQARKVQVPNQRTASLVESISQLPKLGRQRVSIYRANDPVELELAIQGGPVSIWPRKDLSPLLHKAEGLSIVVATEVGAVDKNGKNCFHPKQAAQWILLTSLEVQTLEQAQKVVRYYSMRWLVERLHYTLKSGSLKVERLQFDDVWTTFNALALYTIVAWRILFLTLHVRQNPRCDPNLYFDKLELRVLRSKSDQADQSLDQAVKALGKLVNFVPTSKQPYPGIKVMAQAIHTLNIMTDTLKTFLSYPLQD